MIFQHEPTLVVSISECHITYVSSGGESVVAIDEAGKLWAWGRNDHGQVHHTCFTMAVELFQYFYSKTVVWCCCLS